MPKKVLVDATESKGIGPVGLQRESSGFASSVLLLFAFGTVITLSLYIIFRGMAFLDPGYNWLDRLFAVILLGSESFLFVHTIGYMVSIIKASKRYGTVKDSFFVSVTHPAIAVVVATFNEDPDILEETLSSMSNLDYPNKKLYLLDDSTNEAIRQRIEELGNRYNCAYIHRTNRRGYKAGAINDLIKSLTETYMAVFDADQKPVSNFLSQTTSLLEEDPKLAFVQTPQFYHNTQQNAIAFGAAYQQVVFYEYICEGKSVSNAMFSCGSNVVYRVEALRSVGGFEEKSVTEDFATGLKLHMNGWRSIYYNYVYVYGLGPESLGGYFTQQMRWALGTLGLFKNMVINIIRKPKALKIGQWWEYALSGTYYWTGWSNFLLMLCPIVFLLFDVRPLIANPLFYIAAFVPYFAFAMSTFYFSMRRRGHRPKSLLIGQALSFNTFWILMNAAVMALFDIRRPFGVTPKGKGGKLKLKYLLPQMVLIIASIVAIVFGVYKTFNGYGLATFINVLWAAYHVAILSMVFYFNKEFRIYESKPVYIQPPTVHS